MYLATKKRRWNGHAHADVQINSVHRWKVNQYLHYRWWWLFIISKTVDYVFPYALNENGRGNTIHGAKWKRCIYSFRNTLSKTERNDNCNDILVVERVAQFNGVVFRKTVVIHCEQFVTNNRICKCLCASSHRCCFSSLNEQNTQHNRVFEWLNIECACSKWLLKPHRDAFKTIISHESLVIFKNTTTSAKNFKHFMDSACIEKKKCAQQKGNNWKYVVAQNKRESNSNRDSSE